MSIPKPNVRVEASGNAEPCAVQGRKGCCIDEARMNKGAVMVDEVSRLRRRVQTMLSEAIPVSQHTHSKQCRHSTHTHTHSLSLSIVCLLLACLTGGPLSRECVE